MLVALLVIEKDTTREAENAENPHERKTAAGLLGAGLGISPLVFGRVGQSERGCVNDFGAQAMPELLGRRQQFVGTCSDGVADALENIQSQPQASLTIGAGPFIDRAAVMETKQSLDLSDDFAARATGIERLIKKAPKGAA